MKRNTPEIFLDRFTIEPNSGCWLWDGRLDAEKYAHFQMLGENLAHRVSYRLFKGNIPAGYEIDHLCVVPFCVNPDHLEAVTPLVNWQRSRSPSVAFSQMSHCKNGHEFSGSNVRFYRTKRSKRPRRVCVACERAHSHAQFLERRKGAPPGWQRGLPKGTKYNEPSLRTLKPEMQP